MTARVQHALLSAGGWITGHRQFSNLSICILFEIDGVRLAGLERALIQTGGQLDPETVSRLRQPVLPGDLPGTLQVSFVNQEPALRQEIPPIPG
jgi:hypothetical protein